MPFDHYLSAADRRLSAAPNGLINERIHFLDDLENSWFPRARIAIRRFVSPAERDKVESAFFIDMTQQPEGPLVIASMEKFVARLEGLKNRRVPGAKDACASLERRGLTAGLVQEIKDTIARCKSNMESLPQGTATSRDRAEVARSRRDAYQKLSLWYTDWAETLRVELGYHHRSPSVTRPVGQHGAPPIVKGGTHGRPERRHSVLPTAATGATLWGLPPSAAAAPVPFPSPI